MSIEQEVSVIIPHTVGVMNVSDARELLLAAFEQEDPIVIDLENVAEADVTLAQLLESARRSAALEGRTIRLSKPASGAVLQLLQRGGFLDTSDPARVDFWLQGTTSQ